MGFFSSSSKEEDSKSTKAIEEVKREQVTNASKDMVKTPTTNVSILKDSFKVKATVEGGGSLIIGGEFEGDITIDDTLFVEKGAKFSGTVHAKNVKVAGAFSGVIYSTITEITQSGLFDGNIETNKILLGGDISGIIRSIDSIEVSSTGRVATQECKSKQIKVEGRIEGRVVASELLEVTNSGAISGDIITKGIRTEQGGSIIGNIQTYDDNIHEKDSNQQFAEDAAPKADKLDPEIANLIKIKSGDMKKYARKDDKNIKRIPADKK